MTPKRLPKCSHCKRPTAELDSRRLCASCAAIEDGIQSAFGYAKSIESVAVTVDDRWAIHSTVSHMCFHRGKAAATVAPLIWQAVADRVSMGEKATYPNVCNLARAAAAALGLNISIY
jgi:hypothetical protein